MEKANLARGDRENGRVIIPRARARVERQKMSRILSLLFLAAIIPSVAACTAHTDCGSNAYCYDVGFFTTGVWNSVGSCSYNPAHCCASGDGDPIDRDVTACPSASNCADTSCTAHSQCSSTEYCYDYGKYTTGTWSGVGYCTGDAYLCCAGYDADPIDRDTSNCPTQSYCGSTTGCTAHRHCASTEYCYDTGFFITGVWNGEGQCSMWTNACCGNADADPIDRDVANCPASAGCTSVTSTASNCKEVCEDMNYGRTHCLAVSSSCSWDGTACKSSVGTGSCTYYPNQSSSAVPRIVNAVLFAIAAAIALMLD